MDCHGIVKEYSRRHEKSLQGCYFFEFGFHIVRVEILAERTLNNDLRYKGMLH